MGHYSHSTTSKISTNVSNSASLVHNSDDLHHSPNSVQQAPGERTSTGSVYLTALFKEEKAVSNHPQDSNQDSLPADGPQVKQVYGDLHG